MARKHKPCRQPDRSWTYPATPDVLEEVGLHPIAHYVEVRRHTITKFIVNWPIFDCCVGGERRQGTNHHLWWWDQPMDLDAVRVEAQTSVVVATAGDADPGEG